MAGISFWLAADGSVVRGSIAIAVALMFVTACSFVIAIYFAALSVVRKTINDVGLGRAIFDNLFEHALGVSENDSETQFEQTTTPILISKAEVESKLNSAARAVLADDESSSTLAWPLFWLAKQIQKITVWATVKVVVNSCSSNGQTVDLIQLRNRLASVIDSGIATYLKQYFTRLALSVIAAASFLAILVALGISKLPI